MLWLALIFMLMGGGGSSAPSFTVRSGGDERTFRWVTVAQGRGRTAFAVVREEETDTGNISYFRSACFATTDQATIRLDQLLQMSTSRFAVEELDAPAIDCGSAAAKRLLDEFYPGAD